LAVSELLFLVGFEEGFGCGQEFGLGVLFEEMQVVFVVEGLEGEGRGHRGGFGIGG
jgi:hypothetical protein